CSYCGRAFAPGQPWPRACGRCHHVSYRNPLPVAVVLVPVDRGLLAVRRGIEPGLGKLALPGGYVDFAESWQQAGAREVLEEPGLHLDPREIQDSRVRSSPTRGGILVIFGVAGKRPARDLPPFPPTNETPERVILTAPVELAFPLHTEAVADFFARRRR